MVTLIFKNKHRCFQSVGLLKILSVRGGWQAALFSVTPGWAKCVSVSWHTACCKILMHPMSYWELEVEWDNRWKHSCRLFRIILGCKHFHRQPSLWVSVSGGIHHFNGLPPGINLTLVWLMGQLVCSHSCAGQRLVSQWMPEATSSTQSCLSRPII